MSRTAVLLELASRESPNDERQLETRWDVGGHGRAVWPLPTHSWWCWNVRTFAVPHHPEVVTMTAHLQP